MHAQGGLGDAAEAHHRSIAAADPEHMHQRPPAARPPEEYADNSAERHQPIGAKEWDRLSD